MNDLKLMQAAIVLRTFDCEHCYFQTQGHKHDTLAGGLAGLGVDGQQGGDHGHAHVRGEICPFSN